MPCQVNDDSAEPSRNQDAIGVVGVVLKICWRLNWRGEGYSCSLGLNVPQSDKSTVPDPHRVTPIHREASSTVYYSITSPDLPSISSVGRYVS